MTDKQDFAGVFAAVEDSVGKPPGCAEFVALVVADRQALVAWSAAVDRQEVVARCPEAADRLASV